MEQMSIFEGEHTRNFRAYLKYTGETHSSEVNLSEFMNWMHENLKSFKKLNKIGEYEQLNAEQNELFTIYLLERNPNEDK